MAYHLNLVTTDLIKLNFTKNMLRKCQNIITFFKSYHADALLYDNIIQFIIKGDSLKTSVKIKWSTA